MINRKIAMSGLSILTALTMMGGSAFAAFTTQASATGNTFSSGTENLTVSADNNTFTSSIVSPFSGTNLTPGYTHTFHVFLKNEGVDQLTVSATFANGSGDAELENVLMTDFACTNGSDPSAFSVTSMRGGSVSLGTLAPGVSTDCSLVVTLPSDVDNSASNKSSTFDVLFNGTQ